MRDSLRGVTVCGLLSLASGLSAATAWAQQATTVQLPTFQFFTVTTSVMVPDRGAVVLGGNRTGRVGTNFYSQPLLGPVRSIGSSPAVSHLQIHAQLHDLRARDEALLARTAPSALDARLRPAGSTDGEPPWVAPAAEPASVAAAEQARQAELQTAERVAREFYAQALQAESAGKPSLARAYFQMAAGKASDAFRQEIQRRIAALPPTNPSRTAQFRTPSP